MRKFRSHMIVIISSIVKMSAMKRGGLCIELHRVGQRVWSCDTLLHLHCIVVLGFHYRLWVHLETKKSGFRESILPHHHDNLVYCGLFIDLCMVWKTKHSWLWISTLVTRFIGDIHGRCLVCKKLSHLAHFQVTFQSQSHQ